MCEAKITRVAMQSEINEVSANLLRVQDIQHESKTVDLALAKAFSKGFDFFLILGGKSYFL